MLTVSVRMFHCFLASGVLASCACASCRWCALLLGIRMDRRSDCAWVCSSGWLPRWSKWLMLLGLSLSARRLHVTWAWGRHLVQLRNKLSYHHAIIPAQLPLTQPSAFCRRHSFFALAGHDVPTPCAQNILRWLVSRWVIIHQWIMLGHSTVIGYLPSAWWITYTILLTLHIHKIAFVAKIGSGMTYIWLLWIWRRRRSWMKERSL